MFPAQAGMNRLGGLSSQGNGGVPRTGGDEPAALAGSITTSRCSPHRRG